MVEIHCLYRPLGSSVHSVERVSADAVAVGLFTNRASPVGAQAGSACGGRPASEIDTKV